MKNSQNKIILDICKNKKNILKKEKHHLYKSQYFQHLIEREIRNFKNPELNYSNGAIYRHKM